MFSPVYWMIYNQPIYIMCLQLGNDTRSFFDQ